MGRIQTGPESAGSEPGPACYGRGGDRPAITDADLLLGRLDPDGFAGGSIRLDTAAAERAVDAVIGGPLELSTLAAAFGIAEVVDENMANAARVHAVESGKDVAEHLMVAFGGAAPLHAARLCEKLGVDRCLVPQGAGVGSAIGFLKTPVGYEAVASRLWRLSAFDAQAINALLAELRATAEKFVRVGTGESLETELTAFMRYAGQGWEIPVPLPDRPFGKNDAAFVREAFRESYARFFGRAIDGMGGLEIEIVTWSVKVQAPRAVTPPHRLVDRGRRIAPGQSRDIFDPATGALQASVVVSRDELQPQDLVPGPAVIVERETSTIVTTRFDAVVQSDGSILLVRKGSEE